MKRAILIVPDFHDYPVMLKNELERRGFDVSLYYDEEVHTIDRTCLEDKIDLLFVVKGRYVSKEFVESINASYKLMYQWDSILNFDYSDLRFAFDKTCTFDFNDAKELAIDYVPLFFKRENRSVIKDIDLLFVGFWKDDRFKILKQTKKQLRKAKANLKWKYSLYCPLNYYIKLLIKQKASFSSVVITTPIHPSEMNRLYQRAKCVLDINAIEQTGLTIRTYEALGNGIKLITTNENIINTEIFNENNVSILDRENPVLDLNFIKSDFDESQHEVLKKYEIGVWLDNFEYFKNLEKIS